MLGADQDDMADLEEFLDNFFIRKASYRIANISSKSFRKGGPTIYRGIPLTLAEISRCRQSPDQCKVFISGNWHFQTCIVYAFVAGRGVNNKAYYKYIMDDGTDSMEVTIFANTAKHKRIAALYSEATVLAGLSGTDEDKKLLKSMSNLLFQAKDYIDASVISPGMHVLLEGRPNYFWDKMAFQAYSFCLDNERSRKMEIAFTDSLMERYRKV